MKNITVLDFDHVYHRQSFYEGENVEWVNLESISHTNLFCEKDSLNQINRKLEEKGQSFVTFIGSGNYHYVSYLQLSKMDQPFTLVLFDHHTDTLQNPNHSLITCGSWVLESIKHLPMLKKAIIIGVSEDGLQYIPSSISDKIITFTKEALQTDFPKTVSSIIENISTASIYLSVDKDVLDIKEAVTAWDHGNLKINQLIEIIKNISKSKYVTAADICGEYPINPTNAYKRETRSAIKKNNRTNRELLDAITRYLVPRRFAVV